MDQAVYDLGREQYRKAAGISDMDRDKDGFLLLRPTADHVDNKVISLTTDINSLEEKLRTFKAEREKAVKYQKTDEYKESKKKSKAKKGKKAKSELLDMIFNNADSVHEAEDAEEDEEGYRDTKKRAASKKTTLDTTYGKRFSPVVSMLYDSIRDFDEIARQIDEELNSSRGMSRNMYRSSQFSNLLTAKDKKLSAVKELGSIAKQLSDLEYKKDKDRQASEGDTSKLISSLGAKYLSGSFDTSSKKDKPKDKDSKKGKKGSGNFARSSKKMGYTVDDDEDEDELSIRKDGKAKDVSSGYDLAQELAKEVLGRKNEFTFSAHEKALSMEGKYTFVVAVDPIDPEGTWKFIAVDPKTGKELKDFHEDYKDLYPKKKNARMRFDVSKKKCTDLNTARTYKLVFTD